MQDNNQHHNTESLWANLQKFAAKGTASNIIVGIAVLMLVAQFTGLNPGNVFDRWFGLQEKTQEQSYDLQLKTLDIVETRVISKLDSIYNRLENIDGRVASLEGRVKVIESENKIYHKK